MAHKPLEAIEIETGSKPAASVIWMHGLGADGNDFVPIVRELGYSPVWFGVLFCLNMQVSYLSPPFGPAAFYLKGVSPPHVTLNQIFAGMLPFMGIQVLAIVLMYMFPGVGLWLPELLYK